MSIVKLAKNELAKIFTSALYQFSTLNGRNSRT